jgi:radical SAM-linked protein
MVVEKIRLRFRKDAALRLVSHHDLLRCFERVLRRAALPVHSSQGFHPKASIVFALSLPLGVVGCEEVVELGFDETLDPGDLLKRLNDQAPPGLRFHGAMRVPPRNTAQVRRVTYRITGDARRSEIAQCQAAALLAAAECWVERTRPQPRRVNIRPYLDAIRVSPTSIEIDILVTPNGTARPDESLRALGIGELLDEGNIIERFRMELEDDGPGRQENIPGHAVAAGVSV